MEQTFTKALTNGGQPAHKADVTSVALSENVTTLVTGSKDGTVQLWDLRKQDSTVQTLTFANEAVSSLRFDKTGQYLGVGCSASFSVYHFESKTSLAETVRFA